MKGGKVLGSGAYGCIFRPPLLCKGQTERQQGYVSKLMLEIEAEKEYQEVQRLLQYIVSIPDYKKYFISMTKYEMDEANRFGMIERYNIKSYPTIILDKNDKYFPFNYNHRTIENFKSDCFVSFQPYT